MWVFPSPLGPIKMTLSFRSIKARLLSSVSFFLLMPSTSSMSKLLICLIAGSRDNFSRVFAARCRRWVISKSNRSQSVSTTERSFLDSSCKNVSIELLINPRLSSARLFLRMSSVAVVLIVPPPTLLLHVHTQTTDHKQTGLPSLSPFLPVFVFPVSATVSVETTRSEEHTSELQSRPHLVCRLLLEKKK